MADTTPAGVEADKAHQEGIDHIKATLAERAQGETAPAATTEGATTAATTSEAAPVAAAAEPSTVPAETTPAATAPATETAPVAPIVAAEPPASNPGADDKTGGIAKDAGGLSGAAHKDIPNPAATKEKRKSIFGSMKGYLGLDKKGQAGEKDASDGTYVGAATAAASGAVAAVSGTVASLTGGNATNTTETSEASKAAAATDGTNNAKNADSAPSTAPATDVVDKTHGNTKTEEQNPPGEPNSADAGAANTGSASGDTGDKPPKPVDNVAPENKAAIPSAGGERLGEKHWGESKVVPENPAPKEEEGVASKEGQPSKEVADNTAKNTGGAKPGDATGKTEKKGKFLDKLKEKLPMGKKKSDKA